MTYCKMCQHIMVKQTSADLVKFYCPNCSTTSQGRPDDTLMYSNIRMIDENEMFGNFKVHASEDPCTNKILGKCKKCPMPYMTLIRTGAQERGHLICRCGYEELYR